MNADVLLRLKATAKRAKKEVKKLRKETEATLEKDLQADLDIEDHGRIRKTQERMRRLAKDRNSKISPEIDKFDKKKAEAELKDLEQRHVKVEGMFGTSYVPEDQADNYRGDVTPLGGSGSSNNSPSLTVDQDRMSKRRGGIDAAGTSLEDFKDQIDDAKKSVKASLDDQGMYHSFRDSAGNWQSAKGGFLGNTYRQEGGGGRVIRGQTGRQVTGAPGKRGSTFHGRQAGGFQSRSQREDGQRTGDNLRSIGNIQRPSGVQQWSRKLKKRSRDIKNNFDITEHNLQDLSKQGKKFGQNLRKYTPNIMIWWKVVAILLPMMIALRVQAMGVAAALYSIAGAGAAMVGLGLVGHGENIADSMSLMERRINELKRELFRQFQPVFQEFAPISERFLGTLSRRLQPLVDVLRELTVFEGAFFRLFDDAVGYIQGVVRQLAGYVDVFEQVGRRFLDEAVRRIQNFLDFIVQTSYEEQDAMIGMMDTFSGVVNIIWQIIKAVSQFGALVSPLVQGLSYLITLISDNWVAAILTTSTVIYVLISALNTLIVSIQWVAGASLAKFATAVVTQAGAMSAAISSLAARFMQLRLAAQAAWTAVTLGGAAIAFLGTEMLVDHLGPTNDYGGGQGGSPGSMGGTQGSPTYNTTINVDGETSKRQQRRLEDAVRDIHKDQEEQDDERSY